VYSIEGQGSLTTDEAAAETPSEGGDDGELDDGGGGFGFRQF